MTVKTQDALGAYLLPVLAVAFGVGLFVRAIRELVKMW